MICGETPSRPSDARHPAQVAIDPEPRSPPRMRTSWPRQRSSTRDRLQRSLRGESGHHLCSTPWPRSPSAATPRQGPFCRRHRPPLEGEVIRARDPGPLYRAQRFVRRRWIPICGVLPPSWQGRRCGLPVQGGRGAEAGGGGQQRRLTSLVGSVLSSLNTDLAGRDQGPTATRRCGGSCCGLPGLAGGPGPVPPARPSERSGLRLFRMWDDPGAPHVGNLGGSTMRSPASRPPLNCGPDSSRRARTTCRPAWRPWRHSLLADIHRHGGDNNRHEGCSR